MKSWFHRIFHSALSDNIQSHSRVGLDLDGTLINGSYSSQIQQWLRTTTATVHIITFRSHVCELADFLLTFPQIVETHCLPRDIPEFSAEYQLWKAQVCKQVGATALIDDDIRSVAKGCDRYGIALFDSNHWTEAADFTKIAKKH